MFRWDFLPVVFCVLLIGAATETYSGGIEPGAPPIAVRDHPFFGKVLFIRASRQLGDDVNIYFREFAPYGAVAIVEDADNTNNFYFGWFSAEEAAEITVVSVSCGSGDDNIEFNNLVKDDQGDPVFPNVIAAVAYGNGGNDFCYGSPHAYTEFCTGGDQDGWDVHVNEVYESSCYPHIVAGP